MGASDCIITKAGPGTIAEALICGLPILLNAFIPCQEEGNIPYVQGIGAGDFKERPEEVATTLKQWFSPEFAGELAAMSGRARSAGRPDALLKVCRDLVKLMEEKAGDQGAAGREPQAGWDN